MTLLETPPQAAAPTTRWTPAYALLRAGFPFYATLGMRRVTTYPMDVAIGAEGRLYVLCRDDAGGNSIRRTNWDDEDLGAFSSTGSGPGQMIWPVALLADRDETLYVSDEGLHRISSFRPDGTFLASWGEQGGAPGQLNRPSGMAFDPDGSLWIADTYNHRIQRFTTDGRYLGGLGSFGSGPGELNLPWGVALDPAGDVYVGDWRNDRVQKLSPEGRPLLQLGQSGRGPGQLNRPAGLCVDQHGDIYVADRGNDRVLVFDPHGRYVEQFLGDATLSKSGRIYILANPKVLRAREMTTLEHTKRLRGPAAVHVDEQGRLYIPDFGGHRIQVYQKEADVLAPDQIWPEQKSPFLYTV
jgi:DNA-binding beta-propeller fold protein YncE